MLRARRLVASIARHNVDQFPLYLSVPEQDRQEFARELAGLPCTLCSDEEILAASAMSNGPLPSYFPPHLLQQLVKLEFWRLGLADIYVWIDSDSYFIQDFGRHHFMADTQTPYLFQEEYDPELEAAKMVHVPAKVRHKRLAENTELIKRFQHCFGNSGTMYRFAGSMPISWSVKVLAHLNEEFLQKRGQNIYDFLMDYPCETQLYGEFQHAYKVMSVKPHPFLFRSYLYPEEFYQAQMAGECEYELAESYLGLCIQSNWALVREKRTLTSRLKKHLAALGRDIHGLVKR